MTDFSEITHKTIVGSSSHSQHLSKLMETVVPLLFRVSRKMMPRNRLGDRVVSYINFIMNNNRLPKKQLTLNDVLYRIKTTDEIIDPLRVFVSDKEFLKVFVSATIGPKFNVPTLDVIRDISVLEHYPFPANCCIKPTHASGEFIIRKDNEPLDINRLKSWFRLNYYGQTREANYKSLKPKIIVEPLIFGGAHVEDYKFLCYQGVPKIVWVDLDRHVRHRRKVFDADWNELDFSITKTRSKDPFKKPKNLSEMLEVASKLAAQFSFVRIDLYSDGNSILVGEITNCSGNAGERFLPPEGEAKAARILFGHASAIALEPPNSFIGSRPRTTLSATE